MKRNNKKGFTIVELVIVIAVIAILSAVLIPTFGGIIDQANQSAAQQEARNLYTEYFINHPLADVDYVEVDGYYFDANNGFKFVEVEEGDDALENCLTKGTDGKIVCVVEGCTICK